MSIRTEMYKHDTFLSRFAEEVHGEYEFNEDEHSWSRKLRAPYRKWVMTFEDGWSANREGEIRHSSAEVPFQARESLRFRSWRREGAASAVGLALVLGLGAATTIGVFVMIALAFATGRGGPGEMPLAVPIVVVVGIGLLVFFGVLLWLMRPELELGDAEFQRGVRVRGNDKEKISAFFANVRIRQLFRDQPRGSWLEVDGTGLRFRHDQQLFSDLDQLKSMYELLGTSLDRLVAIGCASPAPRES